MTGPEHYLAAARLMVIAEQTASCEFAYDCQQAAQVHATLALAAACALSPSAPGLPQHGHLGWHAAAGAMDPRT